MTKTAINIIIGRNIRHRRLLSGLTQKAVGNHLNITSQQLQKYESGANNISCDKLIELTVLFQCSVNDLCSEAVIEETAYMTKNPWNPYRVHTLISHFNRIRSHALRNKVCSIVHSIADSISEGYTDTL